MQKNVIIMKFIVRQTIYYSNTQINEFNDRKSEYRI